MRRFFFWILPASAAAVLAVLFAWGFFLGASGRSGETVAEPTATVASKSAASGPFKVLILGDSLARGTGDASGLGISGNLRAQLAARKRPVERIVNLAVNGSRTSDLLLQLESANIQRLISESNVIVLSVGGNDLFGVAGNPMSEPRRSPSDLLDEVQPRVAAVIEAIRKHQPEGRLFLVGLYNPFAAQPNGERVTEAVISWNARLLERFRSDPNFTLVQTFDLFTHRDRLSADRFHPGAEAYRIIAVRIADAM